jgi:ElaB/YqjD/DUF883 family membrane-anchored ribosome-binding protein
MAEPLRTEPLSEMRFPEPAAAPPQAGNEFGPASGDGSRTLPPGDTVTGLLPESNVVELSGRNSGITDQAVEAINTAVDRARQPAERVKDRIDDVRERLESGELQEDVRKRAEYLAGEVSDRARELRSRTQHYARQYPLKFIAGAAAAGFALGFVLRMWRDE